MKSAGPPPMRLELGHLLRALRLAANWRPIDVFDAGLLPVEDLLRYEAGLVRADTDVVHQLCVFYRVDRETTDHVVSLTFRMTTLGVWVDMLTMGVIF